MPGEVKFSLSVDEARAVQGFMNLVAAQNKSKEASHGAAKASHEHNQYLEHTSEVVDEIAKGALSVVTAFASWEGIKKIIEGMAEQLDKVNKGVNTFFEKSGGIRAASLPAYAKDPGGFMRESGNMSTQYGFDVERVNAVRTAAAQREAKGTSKAQLDQDSRSALSFGQNYGEDPLQAFNVSQTLKNAFPKLNTQQAHGLSLGLRNEGSVPVSEQEGVLQPMLLAAQKMNWNEKDVFAITNMAARSGGLASTTGKSIMNAAMKIPELKEKGLLKDSDSPEGYFQQMAAMQENSPSRYNQILKEVGPRSAGGIDFVAKHHEMWQQGQESAAEYESGKPGKELIETLEKDPLVQRVHQQASEEQAVNNAPLNASPQMQTLAMHADQVKRGIELEGQQDQGTGWWTRFRQSANKALDTGMNAIGALDPEGPRGRALRDIAEQAGRSPSVYAPSQSPLAPSGGSPSGDSDKLADHLEAAAHEARALKLNGKPIAMPRNEIHGVQNFIGAQ